MSQKLNEELTVEEKMDKKKVMFVYVLYIAPAINFFSLFLGVALAFFYKKKMSSELGREHIKYQIFIFKALVTGVLCSLGAVLAMVLINIYLMPVSRSVENVVLYIGLTVAVVILIWFFFKAVMGLYHIDKDRMPGNTVENR